jgi:hypothetical protein
MPQNSGHAALRKRQLRWQMTIFPIDKSLFLSGWPRGLSDRAAQTVMQQIQHSLSHGPDAILAMICYTPSLEDAGDDGTAI